MAAETEVADVESLDDRRLACELRACEVCGVSRFMAPGRTICMVCEAKRVD